MNVLYSVLTIATLVLLARKTPVAALNRVQVFIVWMATAVLDLGWLLLVLPILRSQGQLREWKYVSWHWTTAQDAFGVDFGAWLTGTGSVLLVVGLPLLALALTWRWSTSQTNEQPRPSAGPHPRTPLETQEYSDEFIGKHFGHHEQFASRQPGRKWRFHVVSAPVSDLRCMYNDPGVTHENPRGLMGAVGQAPTGHRGAPVAELAAAVRRALQAGTADGTNEALQKVMTFVSCGEEFTLSREEPLALSQLDGCWYVREGTHRAVALSMLGTSTVRAIHFESGLLV